jgi:hypothetical protein
MRNSIRAFAPPNAVFNWEENTGVRVGTDQFTRRPLFEKVSRRVSAWIEADAKTSESFDSDVFNNAEDVRLVGRVLNNCDKSLLLADKIEIELSTGLENGIKLTFTGRVLWANPVAITVSARQFKQKNGIPITLEGKIRRGWSNA